MQTQLAYAEEAAYYPQAVELLESIPTANLEQAQSLNAWSLVSYKAGEGFPEELGKLFNIFHYFSFLLGSCEYPTAEPLLRCALALRERVLGPDHPNTAILREHYAILLRHRLYEAARLPSLGKRIRAWLSRTREPR